MLVLTRAVGERIAIPEANVEIAVCEISKDGRVRIGVEAPRQWRIDRLAPKPDWRESQKKEPARA